MIIFYIQMIYKDFVPGQVQLERVILGYLTYRFEFCLEDKILFYGTAEDSTNLDSTNLLTKRIQLVKINIVFFCLIKETLLCRFGKRSLCGAAWRSVYT